MASQSATLRQKIRLSVFFPAYNEEGNIRSTVEAALRILPRLSLSDWEIVVINDGSTDRTGEVAGQLARKHQKVKVINQQNGGYGQALQTGFDNCRFEWVAFTDSDGQFDFSEVTKFLDRRDEADAVLGYRLKRADSPLRSLYTYGWKIIARALLGLSVKDYSCGFKLVSKKAYEAVKPLTAGEKVTQIEMLVKMQRKGFKFAEVGVHHYPRRSGSQTGARLNVVLRSAIDLIKLWWKLR